MPQSLARNIIHLVYSTKHRKRWLDQAIRPALFAYKAGILKQLESPAITINGTEDHAHILFLLSKNQKLVDVIEEVKKNSSK